MVQKFLFTNSFDDPEPEDTLPLSEVEVLKLRAFEEGRHKGLEEAAESNERRAVEALPLLQNALDQAIEIEREKLEEVTKRAAKICTRIIEKVFPAMTKRGAAAEVSEFIETGLRLCPEELSCVITVNPQLEPILNEYLGRLVPPVSIRIETQPSFSLTDCRVQWGDGGIERLCTSIEAQVAEGLSRLAEEHIDINFRCGNSETERVTKTPEGDILASDEQETSSGKTD